MAIREGQEVCFEIADFERHEPGRAAKGGDEAQARAPRDRAAGGDHDVMKLGGAALIGAQIRAPM